LNKLQEQKFKKEKVVLDVKTQDTKVRMGIYEILSVTKPIKEAILRKATTPEIKEIAKKEGFRTMQDMGRELILTGDLSLENSIEFFQQNKVKCHQKHFTYKGISAGKYVEGKLKH
jgi:type II secretory ATPase GspE/PulE/Tfp pilus assembly ATPase PilB-like protein